MKARKRCRNARHNRSAPIGKGTVMAGKKGYVLRIPGSDLQQFENSFCAYVQTGKEASDGIISDYSGAVDPDGKFFITRRGKDAAKGQNNEAHLMGTISADIEKNETVVTYYTQMSMVFLACMIVLGLFCAGFLTYALIAYFNADKTGPLLPASFFTIGFLVALVISIVRPECRALEKVLETIVNEYAGVISASGDAPAEDVPAAHSEDADAAAEPAAAEEKTAESGEQND